MKKYIFLLGRPGCGKSAVFNYITQKIKNKYPDYNTVRFDDYPILRNIIDNDIDENRHIKGKDGGFLITDDSLWQDLLIELNRKVLTYNKYNTIIFLEFARNKYLDDIKVFDDEIISNSILLYIQCPFDICWQRNVDRVNRQREEGIDAHLTSREEMERTYLNDDGFELPKVYPNTIIIDNSSNNIEVLKESIDKNVIDLVIG